MYARLLIRESQYLTRRIGIALLVQPPLGAVTLY